MRLWWLELIATFVTVQFVMATYGEEAEQSVLTSNVETSSARFKGVITPELTEFIENILTEAKIPGLTLGVVHTTLDGVPEVELGAWGRKTEDGDGHDLTPDSLFNLASVSKAFLAASIGILMDDYAHGRNVTPLPSGLARFDWDTKVADVLPEWKLDDPWATEKANMRDILAHVSGLPAHDSSYGPSDTAATLMTKLPHLRTAWELREKWSYTNMMYMIGAHIVSTYAGMPYPAFAEARIFRPLNMTSTSYSPTRAADSGKLTQSWTSDGRRIPFWFNEHTAFLTAGPGACISSAEDMAKWVAMLLNRGVDPVTHRTILPRGVYEEITTAHFMAKGEPSPVPKGPEFSHRGYGMGWWRLSYQGHEIVTHPGNNPGFCTQVAFLPENGLGVVILTNTNDRLEAVAALVCRIVEDALRLPRKDWPVKMAVVASDAETTVSSESSNGLSLDLAEYAGTYSDPGYGTVTLCAPTSGCESGYCARVLSDFAALEPSGHLGTRPALYAEFPRLFTGHLRLTHHANDTFVAVLSTVFPRGHGKDTSAFEDVEDMARRAVFAVEGGKVRGFALVVDDVAVTSRMRTNGGKLEDAADAWFSKVSTAERVEGEL